MPISPILAPLAPTPRHLARLHITLQLTRLQTPLQQHSFLNQLERYFKSHLQVMKETKEKIPTEEKATKSAQTYPASDDTNPNKLLPCLYP